MDTLRNEALDTLKNAAEFLSNPEHWTRNILARDRAGNVIDYMPADKELRRNIYQACAIGAIGLYGVDKDSETMAFDMMYKFIAAERKELSGFSSPLANFNDWEAESNEDVVKLLKDAIQWVQEGGLDAA
jgi:hypothetical protein